jgi:hypothetical protein
MNAGEAQVPVISYARISSDGELDGHGHDRPVLSQPCG